MLETKYNFSSKCKEIKISRKTKIKMLIRNNKMIYKCKVTFKAICILNNSNKRVMISSQDNRNKMTKKWVQSTINKDKRT
jgi:NhaP-type Na+/H+ and K+/H+ antiporter